MKIGEAFPGQYLKAQDLGTARARVVIDRVSVEEVGDGHKPVLYFRGKDKGLVLNKTNAGMIEEITGSDETDNWTGKTVVLYQTKTDYQGKRVPCIRIDYDRSGKPQAPPPPPPPAEDEIGDDDVPF